MVHKRELTFVLLYLGKLSPDLRTRLRRTMEIDLPYRKLKVIFRSKRILNTLFRYEHPLGKKFTLEQFIVLRVVTAWLLIMGKPSATFKTEL